MDEQLKQIAKESNSSFYYAFSLLEQPKRDAMNAVYAFCRKTDDIVDEGDDSEEIKFERLRKWKNELEKALFSKSDSYLFTKLASIIRQFNIPVDPFFELIKGMEMDLQHTRYRSMDDLVQYCYRVASTVGLMCIEIFGYKNRSAKDYAVNLGLAMQMTNILRDVKKDSERGRIYLPQNDLTNFNYSEEDLFALRYNSNFVSLMKYEAAIAEKYFNKADQSLDFDDKPSMFPARAMQHIYHRLLKKIEREKFDVFNQKIKVGSLEKGAISLGVWAKYSLVY